MTTNLSIALAQINPTVGEINGNIELIETARKEASIGGADIMREMYESGELTKVISGS